MSNQETMPVVVIEDTELLCPVCGYNYLHQHEVEIGWRDEDNDVERHVSNGHGVHVDIVPAKGVLSPNGYGYRRQYLVIRFWCEGCNREGIELEIYQHKGNTRFGWAYLGYPAEGEQPARLD